MSQLKSQNEKFISDNDILRHELRNLVTEISTLNKKMDLLLRNRTGQVLDSVNDGSQHFEVQFKPVDI